MTLLCWWRSWESATGSPTAWRGSSAVAGCCWWPGWRPPGRRGVPGGSRPPSPRSAGIFRGARLDHLEVVGPLWGRGIGTALIRAAEDTARQLGHEQIALGVGLDNPGGSACMSGWAMPTGAREPWWELGGVSQ